MTTIYRKEVWQAEDGTWSWRIVGEVADDGSVIAEEEGYESKRDAKRDARRWMERYFSEPEPAVEPFGPCVVCGRPSERFTFCRIHAPEFYANAGAEDEDDGEGDDD